MMQVSRVSIVLSTRRMTLTMKACGTVEPSAEDHENKSSRMHGKGGEGTELVAHEEALVDDEAQRVESSQNAIGPSSTNVVANMGTQVYRPRYFLLLEIDGFLMWQWFGHSGPLKDHLGLTVKAKLHYFFKLGLKEFLEFRLNNFEVMF